MRVIIILSLLSLSIDGWGMEMEQARAPFAEATDTLRLPCESSESVFIDGETLKYNAYYKLGFIWFKIGKVIFHVEETPTSYILTAEGYSYPSYAWLFPVKDSYKTVLSKTTLRPTMSTKTLSEGDYRLYEYVDYDWLNHQAIVTRGKNKKHTETVIVKLEDCPRDLLSLPYYLRVHDYRTMEKGDVVPFQVFLNKKVYNLNLIYDAQVKKVIEGVGTFEAIEYSTHTVAGTTFGEDGSVLNAYISDDKNKVPLYIESDVYVGSVKLILSDAENLKYPFESKIAEG